MRGGGFKVCKSANLYAKQGGGVLGEGRSGWKEENGGFKNI